MNNQMNPIQKFQKWYFRWKIRQAIRSANKLHELRKYKYMVILYGKSIKVVAKKDLKKMIEMKRFKKGVTIQELEKNAIHVTC